MVDTTGALSNIDDEKPLETYDVLRTRSRIDPTEGFNYGRFGFQDYYGSKYMPALSWVEKIKVGEVTYDPNDTAHNRRLREVQEFIDKFGPQPGLPTPAQIIANEVGPLAGQVAEGVGASFAQGAGLKGGLPFVTSAMDATPSQTLFSNLTSANAAANAGLTDQFTKLSAAGMKDGIIDTAAATKAGVDISALGGQTGLNVMQGAPRMDLLNPSKAAGMQNIKGAAGGAVANFGVQLLLGKDPVKAAKSAGAGAIGKALGTALFMGNPIGGFIGGALGSIIGGRVICNELHNQGLITKKQLINDYKFTRDYLTPTHVNGYHLWAVWMVKQMRKGRFVKFWKHIVLHRANEISYIYGESKKPDYLGKVYRKIFEPTCWLLGLFCKETDWSVLYKQKEI